MTFIIVLSVVIVANVCILIYEIPKAIEIDSTGKPKTE